MLKTMTPYQVIGQPLITEKAYKQVETMNTYTFRVHDSASKNDIKASIEHIYKVRPLSIRVQNVIEKGRNQRKLVRRSYKKAIITLKEGDKIDLAG